MLDILLAFVLMACAGSLYWILIRKLRDRMHALEQDLLGISEVITQLVEFQMKAHEKSSADLEDLEERIMDLSVPSHDSNVPLERRHQVLALARQGVALNDIVKRLRAPIGEAELILNLGKYTGGEISRSAKKNEQVRPYA
jgi:hypothetical protein